MIATMLRVRQILADGHADLSAAALLYMKSMAERHGFTVLEAPPSSPDTPVRIRIDYPLLRDSVFMALLDEAPTQ